jgi:hydroxypyruvate isomerase
MDRRSTIKSMALTGAGIVMGKNILASTEKNTEEDFALKGNIKHSVARWTYDFLTLDELCIAAKKNGLLAIDLLAPKDWPTLKKHGLTCSMCYTAGNISLTDGWADKNNHAQLIKDYTEVIPFMETAGYSNLICFSGNRYKGLNDATGLQNCYEGLSKIINLAQKHGVTLQMELFNSKIDHKDYMCDKTSWGVELCRKLGSTSFKLLYDIYHMQINEGDVIRTIQQYHNYFGHYHTAGVPGRHEIDETQELNYPAIMRAIVATGYMGYVAQEFMPTAKSNIEKVKALRKAVKICDV